MQAVTTIGLDIAKSVFQVHGRSPSHVTAHEAAWGLPGRHPGSSGALDPAAVRRDLLGSAPALLDALPMSFDCDMAYITPASCCDPRTA